MTGISAIIPVYNRAATIARALDSILAQTMPVDDIIVVDDGSSDGTQEIVRAYHDPRIRLIQHETNGGASAARNTGMQAARGDIVAFCDSDDVWLPEKIERQMAYMMAGEYEACCTHIDITYDDGRTFRTVERPYHAALTMEDAAYGCYVSPGSTLIINKHILQAIGGYDVRYRRYEDWDLLIRLLSRGVPFGYLPDSLSCVYADHDYNAASALEGIALIKDAYHGAFRETDARQAFNAGLFFNRAAVYFAQKRYIACMMSITACVMHKPFDNWVVRNILWPRVSA